MFNNNKNFYPTPEKIIDKMTNTIDFSMISTILEPSAGKGNIVEYLEGKKGNKYSYKRYDFSVDCIEKSETLQAVLRGKNYRLIHDDFLTFETFKKYDLIIMNPPFDNGCKHLLKAIELQKNGGAIVCILNAETLKNKCSNDRIILSQILEEQKEKGLCTVEFVENAFIDAERTTNVEIAIIKIQFEQAKKESFIIENLRKGNTYKGKPQKEFYSVTNANFLESIIDQYNFEINAGINLIEEYESMKNSILCSFGKDKNGNTVQKGGSILSINHNVNSFIKEVRGKYWKALFENEEFTKKLTENVKNDFFSKIEELKEYDFTLWNIKEIQKQMVENITKGIEETIIDLFEEMSNKYHYFDETSKNIHYFNGWRTNKSWIINNKVILPYNAFEYSYFSEKKEFKPTKYNGVLKKLKEIEKCFNYLDCGQTQNIDIDQALKFAEEENETKNICLKYFDVTFYKKGTTHITFKNDELLKKFNIYGAQKKGWLPPSYGKSKYSDMTQEEKEVVKEFDGCEANYNKILNNNKYYLVSRKNLLEMKS